MKKSYLFLATTAILSFASCSDNTYPIDQEGGSTGSGGISFSSLTPTLTRATGAEAASLLNNKFIVSGFKGDGSTTNYQVFDNYLVEWTVNTAGTTTSNTSDWEYVGKTAQAPSALASQTVKTQTIKYWDYSASQYDFAAYSLGANTSITTGNPTSGQILVSAITKENATTAPTYTLKGSAEDLAKCYISDMNTVFKADYNKEVQLSFRSLGTKIRVGFYETIPGYSVKDVKFYSDDATTSISTGANETSATLFIPSATSGFGSAGTYTVTFTDKVAQVAFTKDGSAGLVSQKQFGNLTYKAKERNEKTAGNIYLGRSSNDVSFAGTEYNTVLPLSKTATGDVLELRVDYTLVPIDGADETITIHSAKAFVPATYTKWLPNYAYTYIFKISDNTNGWTSTVDGDPAGLFPITFDAVVTDATDANNKQTTITTVDSPSITTYMKGHDYEHDGPEYKVSSDSIYIQVMNGTTLANDLNSKGKLYSVTGADVVVMSEANVMDALNIRTSDIEGTIVGRNGFTLTPVSTAQLATGDATFGTIPGADGNNIKSIAANTAVRFPASAGTYAYVYDYTTGTPSTDEIHTAVELSETPSNWATTYTTYYTNEACTDTAPATFPTLGTGEKVTYYQKYTNLNRTYGVKVIRVK